MNLQFFGGRGSAGGNAKERAEAAANKQATTNRESAGENFSTRLSADERNSRELARVQRENRQSGIESVRSLEKGQSYDIQWSKNEVRQGTYLGGRIINGDSVQEFRGTNGRIMRLDNDDIKKRVRKRG